MSYRKTDAAASAPSQPRRPLRGDFTAETLNRSLTAKRRLARKQQLATFIKEPFSMKSLKLLRTVPGVGLAAALVITGSAGAYAFSNWFNGDVAVNQDSSVFSVDLSACKGNLPPGVDSSDRSNVQFKILGSPHISADDLQQQLLAQCEYDAVRDFYATNGLNDSYLVPTTVRSANDTAVTFEYKWGGEMHSKTLTLLPGAVVYKQGIAGSVNDLHPGAPIVIVANQPTNWQEDVDPLDEINGAQSVFVTQNDVNIAPSIGKKAFYEDSNIMPLDHYSQMQR